VKRLYFDTTYLCRVYSMEPGHTAVKGLLRQAESLATAWHGRAEFATVLLRKRREGSDPVEFLNGLDRQFQRDCQTGLIQTLPLTDAVMRRLESTLRAAPMETFLRAADAMHLACAAENGFTEVYSNDRHFLAAAPLFGMKGIDIMR
jgi:predicted nucleic acid-binding protein